MSIRIPGSCEIRCTNDMQITNTLTVKKDDLCETKIDWSGDEFVIHLYPRESSCNFSITPEELCKNFSIDKAFFEMPEIVCLISKIYNPEDRSGQLLRAFFDRYVSSAELKTINKLYEEHQTIPQSDAELEELIKVFKTTVNEFEKQECRDIEEQMWLESKDEWEIDAENQAAVEEAKSRLKKDRIIGQIIHAHERATGGVIASESETTSFTYNKKENKYYRVEISYADEYSDEDDTAYTIETSYEDIAYDLAKAQSHEKTYKDIYSGCVDVLADDVTTVNIYDKSLEDDVERLQHIIAESLEYESTRNFTVDGDTLIFNENLKTIEVKDTWCITREESGDWIEYPKEEFLKAKTIIIPEGVTSIEEDVFFECEALKKVVLPDSLTYLGKGVFNQCKNLIDVNLPKNLESIEPIVFWGCKSLKKVDIPNSVVKISQHSFADCVGLQEIIIPKSVTEIDKEAFEGSNNFTIICDKGSYAEKFANEHGYSVKCIEKNKIKGMDKA